LKVPLEEKKILQMYLTAEMTTRFVDFIKHIANFTMFLLILQNVLQIQLFQKEHMTTACHKKITSK